MRKKIIEFLYSKFKLREYNTTIKIEFIAAITNYFTMLYLITLVPEVIIDIFPNVIDENGKIIAENIVYNGISAGQILISLNIAALISAGIASILVGYLTNTPLIQGPSLTVATFVSYTVCRNFGYNYPQALGIVFISGIVFFLLAITGIEKRIHSAVPNSIKYAVSSGIGMYIVFQGMLKAHIFEKINNGFSLVNLLTINSNYRKTVLLTIIGLIIIIFLIYKNINGAIFIGKVICIILSIPLGLSGNVSAEKITNVFPFAFSMDIIGLIDYTSLKNILNSLAVIISIVFVICIIDIFETVSTTFTMENLVRMQPKEKYITKEIPKVLEVDSMTTSMGAIVGITTVSTYVESNTGIVEGARTGLTAIITGFLFIITIPFATLTTVVPSAATATTFIIAGAIMTGILKEIDFKDITEALPAVVTIITIIILNKIIVGIAIGIISYVLCNIFALKKKIGIYLVFMSVFMFIMLIFSMK